MLIDLFSKEQSYNVEVAKRFDINTAVYLEALLKIQKETANYGYTYFNIKSNCVYDETGLLEEEQIICYSILRDSGIIVENEEGCRLSLGTLISIFNSDNESLVADLSKITKAANKKSKADFEVAAVKKYVDKTDYPDELKEAYYNWLDMVRVKFNYSNKELFFKAQRDIDAAAKGDLKTAVGILNYAVANGWKKMDWAVQEYFKYVSNTNLKGNVRVERTEVQKDIAF